MGLIGQKEMQIVLQVSFPFVTGSLLKKSTYIPKTSLVHLNWKTQSSAPTEQVTLVHKQQQKNLNHASSHTEVCGYTACIYILHIYIYTAYSISYSQNAGALFHLTIHPPLIAMGSYHICHNVKWVKWKTKDPLLPRSSIQVFQIKARRSSFC